MSKALLTSTNASGTFPISTADFFPIGQGIHDTAFTTEADVKVSLFDAGTLSGLYIYIPTNASLSHTFKSRKNGADGNMSVSVGAAATGAFSDLVHSDSISSGDDVNVSKTSSGAGSFHMAVMNLIYDGADSAATLFSSSFSVGGTSITRYYALGDGENGGASTEANAQFKMKVAGAFSGLSVNISANGRTTASTFKSRKNTADGNLTVSLTAATTGMFEDSAHSDTIAVDDLYNLALVQGTGTGTITSRAAAVLFNSNTDYTPIVSTDQLGNETVAASTTVYYAFGGTAVDTGSSGVSEANLACDTNFACALSYLQCQIKTNGISATSTLRLRKNSSNGTQAASITASTTGWFVDASGTDTASGTDELNFSITTGGSGTSLVPLQISCLIAKGGTLYTSDFTETVTLVDTLSKTPGKMLTDVITLVDAVTKMAGKRLFDFITLVDSVTTVRSASILLNETIILVDRIAKMPTKVLSEVMTLVDSITTQTTFVRAFDEVITLVDTITRTPGKVLTETVELVDTVAKTTTKALTETMTLVDTVLREIGRSFTETITLVDTMVKTPGKVLTETLTLVARISITLNGVIAGLWARVTRVTSSWGKTSRTTGDWDEVPRSEDDWDKIDRA